MDASMYCGRTAAQWLEVFHLCHCELPFGAVLQWCWPDERPALRQLYSVVAVFSMVKEQLGIQAKQNAVNAAMKNK